MTVKEFETLLRKWHPEIYKVWSSEEAVPMKMKRVCVKVGFLTTSKLSLEENLQLLWEFI